MNKQQFEAFIQIISSISYNDWCKIRICVEKSFDSAKGRVQLQNAESLKILLTQVPDFKENIPDAVSSKHLEECVKKSVEDTFSHYSDDIHE